MITRKSAKATLAILAACLLSAGNAGAAYSATPPKGAEAQITNELATYIQSINDGSSALGAKVFDASPQTVFIHPRGTERGWDAIKTDIYDFFANTFSQRKLQAVGAPHITIYGDSAVLDFEWDFVATFKKDGAPLHTQGRESQVFHKFPGRGWRIVHLHYSGPAVTAARQGF